MSLKRLIPLLVLTLAVIVPAEAKKKKGKEEGKAVITFAVDSHDFGIISPDRKFVTTEFEFVNTGDAPLVIYDATADCGCTRPQFPKNPVAPGKTGKIKVNFIPKGYAGGFSKNVKVRSNGSSKAKVLRIKGVVNPNKN